MTARVGPVADRLREGGSMRDNDGCVAGVLITIMGGLLLMMCFGGCYGCSKVQTSDGYRECVVQKVSHTGIVFKTWEVEAVSKEMMVRDGSLRSEVFHYSVTDPAVIEQLRALSPNTLVRLHYRKQAVPWAPSGESNYFIARVEIVR